MRPEGEFSPVIYKRDISVVVTRIQDEAHTEFIRTLIKKANENGFRVIVFAAFTDFYLMDNYDQGEIHAFELLAFEQMQAMIILGTSFHNDDIICSLVQKAREHNVFTVCIDKHIEGSCYIGFDYVSAFETIVRHVIDEHECRNICVVAGMKGNTFSEERIECCRRVMKEHGLKLEEERIIYGDFRPIETEREFDKFMKSGLSMPDAFICCNDTMAITVCKKLEDYGYSVPDDVIVTGFDGIPEVQYHIPRLTTAKQDISRAAELSVEIVMKYLDGEEYENSYTISNVPEISESCGCCPTDYRDFSANTLSLVKTMEDDSKYDTLMFEMENVCSKAAGIEELSDAILDYSGCYGKHYFALAMKEDYMKISGTYESLVYSEVSYQHKGTNLVLCDSTGDKRFKPIYAERPPHFLDVVAGMSAFLFWSIHFQDTWMGHGIMGISMGCDGKEANDDFRNLLKYTRNLNHVLEMANSHTVMKNIISKLRDMYIHDRTGLYNRSGFYSEIDKMLDSAQKDTENKHSIVIISIDMDGLKHINDNYGHAEGDAAIRAISDAIMSIWSDTEVCARFGGDEFIVASVCGEAPEERGRLIVEKVKTFLDDFNEASGKPYKVTTSCGFHCEEVEPSLVIDHLIKEADALMYREKFTHKNSRLSSEG